jgi:MFS family permease
MQHQSLRSIITTATVGTIIEWYDFFIFGGLASIISAQFFPKENPTAAFLATLATFAAGLVVRPFGALFFGRLGDLIGRKYTFMATLVLMGGSTFLTGLVPGYERIGFFAPLIVLVLRLLQGLAIGGETGGATTFVAEHAPVRQRGYWTSWIQIAGPCGLLLSFGVILLSKNFIDTAAWEAWGWRIPFLVSILLVGISLYVRKNMAESPLFAQAKAKGETSRNPLKEALGEKENLKVVLLALFGLTLGIGVASYASVVYVQNFLIKFRFLDYNQTTYIVIGGLLLGNPFYVFFGWLSDRVGRKPLLMLGLLLAIFCFRPIYTQMYQVSDLQYKTENKSASTGTVQKQFLQANGDSLLTTTTQRVYTDGTIYQEIKKQTLHNGQLSNAEMAESIKLNTADLWSLIFLMALLVIICGMSASPSTAFLVELFPLKIRYTSFSLPYHISYGIFGGMAPVIATYSINKANLAHATQYYLAGLTYPIVLMSISFIIGLLYLKEKNSDNPQPTVFSSYLNRAKKMLGGIWMLLGIAAAYFGIFELGIPKISSGLPDDLIFGLIAMLIITPVASIGLFLFGKYAWQGSYSS